MSQYVDLAPSPASLMESLRDIGYSMETAIADIIDNSITANAKCIDIDFSFNEGSPWLAVSDDGIGMTAQDLQNAMRFGSQNPIEDRPADDLGRFGLGMKTASLSQCRRLTVISKKASKISCCQWDIDWILEQENPGWFLRILSTEDIHSIPILATLQDRYLDSRKTGTVVYWDKFDRFEKQSSKKQDETYFDSEVHSSREHLEMVFHRFLSPDPGGRHKIKIRMNGDELEAFNPFNPNHPATQELEEQQITIHDRKVYVQPYVLPHYSKLPREIYSRYAGEAGYLQNQGFYVYRNKRLIIKGTWFRLIKKEELNKLIRVKVDIPNTLDHLWKIDVKKSQAALPEVIKKELNKIIHKIEVKGKKVYRQRGKKLASKKQYPVWNRIARKQSIEYRINRDHPMIQMLFDELPAEHHQYIKKIISVFESSFPRDMYFHDIAGNPEQVQSPDLSERDIKNLLDIFIDTWSSNGMTMPEIRERIFTIEPFSSSPGLTEVLLEKGGYPQ